MTETLDATPDFLSEPTFLPRVTQHDGRAIEEALAATLFDKGVRLRGAVVEASYAATDPPLLKRLRVDNFTLAGGFVVSKGETINLQCSKSVPASGARIPAANVVAIEVGGVTGYPD
ncbi:MAG: hypothetical protein JJE35_05940 [Thermoleophilia bacterium]|nr:hypothetical protein [Thermoleophilia bacterium]